MVSGPGTMFEMVNTGTATAPQYASTPTTLVSFEGTDVASRGVIADANGDLFATTTQGQVLEIANTGTVAAPQYASAVITLASLDSSSSSPSSGLIVDANGDLFGTTIGEVGTSLYATVFEMANIGTVAAPKYASTPTTLASFNGSALPFYQPDGGGGMAPNLIVDAKGDLFGTAYGDGPGAYGSVFEIVNTGTPLAPQYASSPTTIVSFSGDPSNGLIADANGDLFGATVTDEATGTGSVFEITGSGFVPFGAPATGGPTTVAPTITGTAAGQTTTSEAPVTPFSHVTIGDANSGATDTLSIQLTGGGGTLADGAGFTGLVTGTAGLYTLTGTAAGITAELDALVFTPAAGAAGVSATTTFALTDTTSVNTRATDSTISVIDSDPGLPSTTPAPIITSASYSKRWILGGSAAARSTVTVYDGATELGTMTASSIGAWAFTTAENNSAIRDYTVTATVAGSTSIPSAADFEGTPGADTFSFASEGALSAAALINGGAATDTVQITGPATLTDADFAHALSIEILRLDGASSVTLGTNASAAGIKTVVTGNGATSITDSNSGTLTVNATALGAGNTLTLAGTTTMTVTGLTGNLNATGDSGALTVSANGTTPQTVATGSGAMSIANSATGGSVTVNAAALLGTSKLTLSGSSAKTVNNLAGNLVVTGAGPIAVTATGKGPQTIETGSGNDTIIAATGGDTIQGGGGGDSINVSGHTVADSFIYAARSDSLNTSVGHDTITGFLASGSIYDQLDFSKLNAGVSIEGQVSSGSSVAADSIAWLYPGGNAMLYVNDTARALATGSTSLMEITLAGVSSGLSASNFRA
jgi:hypothetical protein